MSYDKETLQKLLKSEPDLGIIAIKAYALEGVPIGKLMELFEEDKQCILKNRAKGINCHVYGCLANWALTFRQSAAKRNKPIIHEISIHNCCGDFNFSKLKFIHKVRHSNLNKCLSKAIRVILNLIVYDKCKDNDNRSDKESNED